MIGLDKSRNFTEIDNRRLLVASWLRSCELITCAAGFPSRNPEVSKSGRHWHLTFVSIDDWRGSRWLLLAPGRKTRTRRWRWRDQDRERERGGGEEADRYLRQGRWCCNRGARGGPGAMTSVHQEQGYGGSSQPVTVSGESRSGWFPPQVADQARKRPRVNQLPCSTVFSSTR